MIKPIFQFVIASLAYYLSGKLGLLLAIPPGFASAVWPASGVALACVLLFKALPASLGIGFGSFILNLGLTSQGYNELSWSTSAPALMIAFGASIQCLVGGYLFKRLIGFPSLIDSPGDIFRFAFIIGPVTCVIAASAGVAALSYFNLITDMNVLFSWFTWWSGDTIGVLLFTPPILMTFSVRQAFSSSRKVQIALPTLLLFVGVIFLFFSSTHSQNQSIRTEINDTASEFNQKIKERINISKGKLNAYVAFYSGTTDISQNEFNAFSKIILNNDTVFQAIGWTEIVPHSQRKKYEAAIQASGYPNFGFTEIQKDGKLIPATEQSEYYPVRYIYPLATNRKAFGLNLAANPQRLKALIQARQLAKPFSTAPITLAQGNGSKYGYILYLPVFHDELFDREHFRGYISGVFRIEELFGDLIKGAQKLNFGLAIDDITQADNIIPIAATTRTPFIQFEPVINTFDFGGRTIKVKFYADNEYQIASKDWASWTILSAGLLIVAILQSFILMLTGNTENIRREVARKTQALYESKKAAEEANKSKSLFTANMSHEIRTPLHAITGFINLCLKTPLNSLQNNYLQNAKIASGTLLSLVNQILDYSKIDSGKLELEKIAFDFPEVLQKIQAIFSNEADQKNLTFTIRLPQTIPDRLLGDPLRLEQILLNLCSNAFKFTSEGSIDILLETQVLENSIISLDFTIADTGIGVPADQQEYLFQSYRQADSSTSRKFGGSGLGLTISKELIKLMHGSISMSSEENKGSQFNVHLHLATLPETHYINSKEALVIAAPVTKKSTDSLASIPEQDKSLNGLSLLLAEDVAVNQIIATTILESHGAKVTIVNNGLEALKTLKGDDEFDLVLMDIQMPEMDGYTATKKIREIEKYKQLPIIAMTANAMNEDIIQSNEAGMSGHISKPYTEDDLIDIILSHVK